MALQLSFAKDVGDQYQIFKTFIPVTIQTCRDECERRPRCIAAAYQRRYSLCELASRQDTNRNDTGVVMLTGPKLNTECGDRMCSVEETCIDEGNNKVCRVTECIEPARKFPTYFGNNYTIDSHIIYRGRPHGIDLQRVCLENGEWSQDVTRVTHDCFDVTGPSGVYWQPVLGTAIFCDMDTDGGKWMVFQRRQDGSVDFYRNWESYEDGFGNLPGEFWMGLTTIHNVVSNSHYVLRIDMESFQRKHGYANYAKFSISGPETGYTLTVLRFDGNRGDSLMFHNGKKFSTYDRDQDPVISVNCAEKFKGAWWYDDCHKSNLNGLYDADGIVDAGVYATNILWRSWTGFNYSLKETSMKFRRKL